MRIVDPHIHMTSRTTDDYERMYAHGVRVVVEPAFWLGQPRTSVGSYLDYIDGLLGWEPFRAAQFGIRHHCALALNPKEANDPRLTALLDELPRYLEKDGVVAVGEVGFDMGTPEEEKAFVRQVKLAVAHGLPVLVHTPHRDKAEGTRRTLAVLRDVGVAPDRVLVDHLNELTVEMVLDAGHWAGFSVYPDTKMEERRMVALLHAYGLEHMVVNSAADWGRSDPLTPYRVGRLMLAEGFSDADVDRVLWRNPVTFYGQSGRFETDLAEATDPAGFLGNSVVRGARD